MEYARKDTKPAAPTAAKHTSATGNQDGMAVYGNDSATLGSPLWGFRQYRRTVAELRNAADAVDAAASRAVSRANKLANVAEQDNMLAAGAIGCAYDTTLSADLDRLLTAAANLASAVNDVCEIAHIGG